MHSITEDHLKGFHVTPRSATGFRFTSLAMLLFFLCSVAGTTHFAVINGLDLPIQIVALGMLAILVLRILLIQRIPIISLLTRTLVYQVYLLLTIYIVTLFHWETINMNFVAYLIVGFILVVLVPFSFTRRPYMLDFFLMTLKWTGACLAIPTILGAAGLDSFLGLSMNNKTDYANFSSITASSGIFDFPATMGTQFGMSLIATFWLRQRNLSQNGIVFFCVLGLIFVGLVITQARGALLGITICGATFVVAKYLKFSGVKLLLIIILGALSPLFILEILSTIPGVNSFLRAERGLSGREGGWNFAISQIEQKPWTGYGFNGSSTITQFYAEQLKEVRFRAAGASFHNTYISIAVNYGVFSAVALICIYLTAIWRTAKFAAINPEARHTMNMIIVIFVAGLYKDINLGGLRSISVVAAIFIGYALIKEFDFRVKHWR